MEKNTLTYTLRVGALILIVLLILSCGKRKPDSEAPVEIVSESAEFDDIINGISPDSLSGLYTQDSGHASKPAEADTTDLKTFQYSWTDSKNIPPVIIIVDDFGYAEGDLLQSFADLPREVVFAILPDLPGTKKTAQIAQKTGRDVIIHAPMEAKMAKIKPGERYLKSGQESDTVAAMIDAFYEQMPMAIALNNHMGSTATADRALMRKVLDHLDRRGLYFVDSVTIKETVGFNLANTLGYRSVRRNLFLDVPDNSDATIAARISDLGRYKGRVEPVVVITHCHNRAKLEALKKFIAQIKDMGVKLTSLSAFYGGAVASR